MIEPTWTNGDVRLYQGDCLDVMRTMQDESVALVVTSPPYGDMYFGLDIDKCRMLIQSSIREIERILVPGGKFIINVNNYVTSRSKGWAKRQIIPMTRWVQESCKLLYQDEIFWYKKLAQGGRSKPLFGSYPYPPNFLMCQRIEYVLVYAKDGSRNVSKETKEASRVSVEEWREWTQNLWSIMDGNYSKDHPAPFPIELPRRLIKLYSFVGDTALDPFSGIGTTALACMETGRKAIGIELSREYIDLSIKHLCMARQDNLF